MKKLVFLLLIIGCMFTAGSVHATYTHTEWSTWHTGEWGKCVPTKECGSEKGTQTRVKTKTCIIQSGGGYNECYPVGSTQTQTESRNCEVKYVPCQPEVTPTPVPGPNISDGKSDGKSSNPDATKAPQCSDGVTVQLPANVHVIRNGKEATVNFFITEGNSANIYYKDNNSTEWQHAVSDVKPNGDNFVSYTIGGLDPNVGYTFGIQQKKGCGGGQLVESVVIDGPQSTVFMFSFWRWSK
jgi:hypothetical protein